MRLFLRFLEFMEYINPFELLQIHTGAADEPTVFDEKYLRRARRRLLTEADLEGSLQFKKISLTKNEIAAALDELDDDDRFENHKLIYESRLLLNFLNDGDSEIFDTADGSKISDYCTNFDFIAKPFSNKFNILFTDSFFESNDWQIENMSLFLSFVDDVYHEDCYESVEAHLKEQVDEYETLLSDVEKSDANFSHNELKEITTKISDAVYPETLNALPDYFQIKRDQLAHLIDQIAAYLYNNFKETENALWLSQMADEIEITSLNRTRIRENKEFFEKKSAQLEFAKRLEKIERVASIASQLKAIRGEFSFRFAANVRDNLLGNRIYIGGIKKQIQEILDFTEINNLSEELDFTGKIRDEIAVELKGLSVVSYNFADDLDFALWLLEMALQIRVSPEIYGKLLKSKNQLLGKLSQKPKVKYASVSEKFYTNEESLPQPEINSEQYKTNSAPPNFGRNKSSHSNADFGKYHSASPFEQEPVSSFSSSQRRLFYCIVSTVILVCAAVGFYISLQPGAIKPRVNSAELKEISLEPGFNFPIRNSVKLNQVKFKGKILPISPQTKTIDWDVYNQLPSTLKPIIISQVKTFITISCKTGRIAGYYTDGASGSIRECELIVADKTQNAVVGKKTFEEKPPSLKTDHKSKTGEIPYKQIMDYLIGNLEQ